MKNRVIELLVASFLILSLMSFMKPQKWFSFESEKYGCKIEFPGEPSENPQVVNSQIGELKMNTIMYDASMNGKDDNMLYMLNYTEYPDTIISSEKTEILSSFFRNSIDGAVTNVDGKLLSEKIIQKGNFPGRELMIEIQDGMAVILMRIYLVKNRMYLLQTISENDKDFSKSITRFMDSFELLDTGIDRK